MQVRQSRGPRQKQQPGGSASLEASGTARVNLWGVPTRLVDRPAVSNPSLSAELRAILLGTTLFAALRRRSVLGLELGQHGVE